VREGPAADGEERRDPAVFQGLADDRVTEHPGGTENQRPQSPSGTTGSGSLSGAASTGRAEPDPFGAFFRRGRMS